MPLERLGSGDRMLVVKPVRSKAPAVPSQGRIFDVSRNGETIGELRSIEGVIKLCGQTYTLGGAGDDAGSVEILATLAKGDISNRNSNPVLLRNSRDAVMAASARVGRRGFAVSHGGQVFRFERGAFGDDSWYLYAQSGDAPLGSVARQGWFGGLACTVELPPTFPDPVHVFLFWLRYHYELERWVTKVS